MATIEELDIIIEVIDRYSREIDELIAQLTVLEGVAESAEDIRINVSVMGERKLDALLARMSALQFMDTEVGMRGRASAGQAAQAISGASIGDIDAATMRVTAGVVNLMGAAQGGGLGGAVPNVGELATSFKNAEESGNLLSVSMSDFHNALASAIPLLLVFIGALPALIAAVVALATAMIAAVAAFGAIAGIGALGFAMGRADGQMPSMKDFTEIFYEIRDSFFEAFAPLSERLLPTFERALSGIDVLFQRIADRGDILIAIRSQFLAFGRFLLDWIPNTLENMGRMVMAFDEVFSMLGDFFTNTSFTAGLTEFFADALPALTEFSRILVDIIPGLLRFSIGLLQVANAFVKVFTWFTGLLGLLPLTSEQLGILIGTILTLTTAILILNSTALARLGAMIVTIGSTSIPYMIGGLVGATEAIIGMSVSAFTLTNAVAVLRVAIVGLLAVTGVGLLIPIIGSIGSAFLGMGNDVKYAADQLREFNDLSNRTSGTNPYGASPTVRRGTALRDRRSGGTTSITITGDADDQALDRAVSRINYASYRSTFRP